MNESVRGVCQRPELLRSLSSTLKRSFRSYLPIFGIIFSIALFLKSSGFKGFLRVAHSFGVVLPKKLVFLQKKTIWSCPLYGHFVDFSDSNVSF